MCDDLFDDFDDNFDDSDNSNFDNDELDCDDNEIEYDEEIGPVENNSFWDGPDWRDWMIIGPLSEDIARDKIEKERIRRDEEGSDDDYWDIINEK
jgi:hypothetical protein